MTSGPGLFSDIGKKAKDLLTRDYISDPKFSVSTTSATGVTLTSTATKKGGLSSGDLGAVYKYKNTLIDIKLDTESNIATTLTFTDIVPSTKTIASFKLPDLKSGKVEVQYFHYHASLTSAVTLNETPTIDVSATIGTPTFVIGAEGGYETSSGKITKYTAGISINKPDSCASIVLGDKGDSIRASYIHHLDALKKSGAVGEISRRFSTNENTFTVGGSYAVDSLTLVKAKLNNHGKLGALLQHEIIPKSLLTMSTELDTRALDRTPKFGIGSIRKENIVWHKCSVEKSDREELLQQKVCVIWSTGLSGSGKSTLACALTRALHSRGKLTYVLDGDNVRHGLNSDLTFQAEDRAENIRRIGEVAKLFTDAGVICIASVISPYRKDSYACRSILPEGDFIERSKGFIARAGKIKGFTGVDDPYEPPLNSVIVIQQQGEVCPPPEVMAEKVISYLDAKGYLQA